MLVLHVVGLEQAQHRWRILGRLQLFAVPGIGTAGVGGLPFGDQVAAIAALAGLAGVLRVGLGAGHEPGPAATQQHLRPTTVGGGDQLPGDVDAALGHGLIGQVAVVLPVAFRAVGPGRRRGGVGEPGGADDAGGHAGAVGQLQPGQAVLAQAVGAVAAVAGRNTDRAHVGLHPGGDRGHGPGRIGSLRIDVVGLAEAGVRELFPAQQVLLAGLAAALAVQDPCGGHRGQAHAVAQEQDHVLRTAGHRAAGGSLGGAAAVPPGRGFAARVRHHRHLHRDRGAGLWRRGGSGAGAGAQQQAAGGGQGKRQGANRHQPGSGCGRAAAAGTTDRQAAPRPAPGDAEGECALCRRGDVLQVTSRRSTGAVASAGALGYRARFPPIGGSASR